MNLRVRSHRRVAQHLCFAVATAETLHQSAIVRMIETLEIAPTSKVAGDEVGRLRELELGERKREHRRDGGTNPGLSKCTKQSEIVCTVDGAQHDVGLLLTNVMSNPL